MLHKASEYAKVDREATVFSHYGTMIPGVGIAESVWLRRAMAEHARAEIAGSTETVLRDGAERN